MTLTLATAAGPAAAATSPFSAAVPPATVAQAAATQATIQGLVTGTGGVPLGGATVLLDGPTHASVVTDATGTFTFSVPPGSYTVIVNKGGYQSGSTDVIGAAGTATTVNVGLTESSLNNLQVIGRTSSAAARNAATFNISSSPVATLSNALIQQRDVPETAKLIGTLPGIVVTTNSASVINNFRIRGTTAEGKTELDGHPVSSGTSGTFVASFLDSGLIGSVDVLKGAGLNGPTAGESAVGTVNLRTPDFSAKDSGYFQAGVDQYGGTFLTALADVNIGKKLSFILGKSFSGYVGNGNGLYVDGLVAGAGASTANAGPKPPYTGTYSAPYLTNNLAAYSQNYSSPQILNSQLAKMRFKFSDATSVSFEFIGFQGQYNPQGGSYGQLAGYALLPQCLTKGVAASGSGCNLTSVYNAPAAQSQIGSVVPLYTFFPGTVMQNNNPNFSAEFKTTFHNDTLFFRPYAATISRLVNENGATSIYGNGPTQIAQGSYEVINNANCQVQFIAPTATGGAKGPCYTSGSPTGSSAFVNTLPAGVSTAFPVTTNANGITCSLATPCYTSPTQQNNAGVWGFGNVGTTLETDKLAGYTFTYIHPIGDNIFNFSIDHYYDDTQSTQNDPSPLVPGCSFTQLGGAAPTNPLDPGYQAGCNLIGPNGTNTVYYKPTSIAIPETFSSITSFSLTAQLQLLPALEFDLGNYLTMYTINGQQESPAYLASFVAAQQAVGDAVNTAIAPIVLSGTVDKATHYDPHFGFVFRPKRDVVVRLTYGSSVSIPYASQVSGLDTVATTTAGTTFTQPNPNLKAEEIVATDLGTDFRVGKGFARGTTFSIDLYNNVIHNAWITQNILLPAAPSGYAAGGTYYQTSTFNGPEEHAKGIEFNVADLPALGFGYSLSTSFNRTYYFNLPISFLQVGQYQYDGAQAYGEPYSKGYLNLQYAAKNNSLLRFGIDYEGPGNSANYTSYFQLDAGLRIGFPHGYEFQTAVENLSGLNFGTVYGHGVLNQGTNPILQTTSATGVTTYSAGPSRGISAPLPRTYRFSLAKRF